MPHPDLFVVCKNCQAEVSPYITECPYCGMRLRKRAPKIERPDAPPPKPPRRLGRGTSRGRAKTPRPAAEPRLGRLRGGEIPGIRGDALAKPWATIVLVALSFGIWFSLAFYASENFALTALGGDPWRYVTASLLNGNTATQFVIVLGLGLFGWLIERRHGPIVVVALFALCGPGALAIAVALDPGAGVFGSQGAALGLLCAWVVPVLIARRRGTGDDDVDLLGALVIGVVLLLAPVLAQGDVVSGVSVGSTFAELVGAGLGALAGLVLPTRPAR
jgi:membrane associated rhomboid family serine protease